MPSPDVKNFLLKRCLHWIGGALGIAGVFFVVRRLLNATESIGIDRLLQIPVDNLFFLIIIYAVSNVLSALAWRELLLYSGETTVGYAQSIRIYALSQLAKYLPGNVFHLAGRQALGISAGFSGKALLKSIIGELGLLSFTATFFVFLTLPAYPLKISPTLAFSLFGFFLCLALLLLKRFMNTRVVRGFILQLVFLGIYGYIFIRCLALFGTKVTSTDFLVTLGVYVVSWLAGFVTPGAPAGLGVREAVLLFFLNDRVAESPLLLATILVRIISISGDVLFYAGGVLGAFLCRHSMEETKKK